RRQTSGEQRRIRAIRDAALREGAGLCAWRRYCLPHVQPAHAARNALHRIKSGAFDHVVRCVNRP
ncbi:MAG: hypothetical protein Q9M29_09290, partial [Mariprofundaceae bacterium]|nr:hypothetical protein [Mariprofundaceae bacterium]